MRSDRRTHIPCDNTSRLAYEQRRRSPWLRYILFGVFIGLIAGQLVESKTTCEELSANNSRSCVD